MSQQKQAPEAAETYRHFIKQLIDEIQDPNALWRLYTLVLLQWKREAAA